MCYKLVDDVSGKIFCRSVIRSATTPGTANLCIDRIKILPPDAIHSTEPDTMFDQMTILADFETPLSDVDKNDPFDLIPSSTKSKNWQEMEKNGQVEH